LHKFEKLEVWKLAIEYIDICYSIAEKLPEKERYNLSSQLSRAAVSVALNIAEGSTGQSDPEQNRFLSMALRSLVETVACQHLVYRRKYLESPALLKDAYKSSEKLAAKINALRTSLRTNTRVREVSSDYITENETPFDESQ
jgi:four helix bundle protein